MKQRRPSRYKTAQLWWLVLFLVALVISLKLPAGQKLSIAMAPLLHVVQAPVRWYQDFSLWFEDSVQLQAKYIQLSREQAEQKSLNLELAALKAENTQLRQLLKITDIHAFSWRAAPVISRGQEVKSRQLMLQIQNAHQDDVVVSHEGLVGLVDHSGKTHAVVRTVLDASLAIPVTMRNSSLAALVRGDGERLIVDFIPLAKAPKVGDVLVTSGAGGLFPEGLPVANVEAVEAVEGGVFAEVQAKPVANWQRDAWLAIAAKTKP